MKKAKEKSLQKEVKTIATNSNKRKLTQEDINYLMEKHAYCLKLLEDK